jgi:hypothetical protein
MRCDLKIPYKSNVAQDLFNFSEPGVLHGSLPRCYTKFLSVDVSKSLTRAEHRLCFCLTSMSDRKLHEAFLSCNFSYFT